MPYLVTTLGKKSADELGMILPHEHVFVDLRTWDKPGYGEANAADVVAMMHPEIEKIKAQGITALVECSALGVGRRADLDKAVSEAAQFPIVVPTGVYREPWLLPWVHDARPEVLVEWMRSELEQEIESSGVQAGWIKVSAGDDGITPAETKVLRAAAQAAMRVNAVIGSHTVRGRVVQDQLDIIEDAGYTTNRFIWIHTQAEPDFELHLMLARRGVWLEYDSIGNEDDEKHLTNILRVLDAGFGNQLLLSHDRGWYDPASPGRDLKPYTYLVDTFLPKLRARGVHEATIHQLTHINPFKAFARD